MTVIFDMSRLIARQGFATPTGIDRFELGYAQWIRDSMRDPVFVETGPTGPAILRQEHACELIDAVGSRWANTALSPDQARQLEAIVAAIEGRQPWRCQRPAQASGGRPPPLARTAQAMRLLASAWTPLPSDRLFIHVSHARLDRPSAFSWLHGHRPRGIFYVHDLIPLSHPEFVRASEPDRHMQRMRTVLSHASLVLCNSQTTAVALDRLAEARRLPQPRSAIVPPGVDEAFLRLPAAEAVRTSWPYFVCVGTIEPRKNHMLLLNLWRRLTESHGAHAPRLVIVGRRGWDNAQLFRLLDRPAMLHDTVIEVSDLADAPLARLLAGASALLAPSFIEGYGMPVAEALAVGTPVIASDIGSHREIAGGAAVLLDPLNGREWLRAIEVHAAARRRRGARFGAARSLPTWAGHFGMLERLIATEHRAPIRVPASPVRAAPAEPAQSRPLLGGWLRFANSS